ncbi:hypothetical protein EZV73_26670 [Acidaminobacter sp. JC074]|uniref:hypothetical protein n=1 Tax=Acidaminobacter sp. JC074 TaxID=2530199 RepID=UPI001F0F3285|nr:hypothetical protein [Acidaminobacter sp. JC074]MCH4891191.1 hypothetical protein [Acidaminobacter sp. JC074]
MIKYFMSNKYFIYFILEIEKIITSLDVKDYISIIGIVVTAIFSLMLFLNNKKSNVIAEKLYNIEKSNAERVLSEKNILLEKNAQELYNYLKLSLSSLIDQYFTIKKESDLDCTTIVYEWTSNISILKENLTTKEVDLLYGLNNSLLKLKRVEDDNAKYRTEVNRIIALYFDEFLISKIDLDYHDNHLIYCDIMFLRLLDKLYRMYIDSDMKKDIFQLESINSMTNIVHFSIDAPHNPIVSLVYDNDNLISVKVYPIVAVKEKFLSLVQKLNRYCKMDVTLSTFSKKICEKLEGMCLSFELDEVGRQYYFDNYLVANQNIIQESGEDMSIIFCIEYFDEELTSYGLIKRSNNYTREDFELYKIGKYVNGKLIEGIRIEYSTKYAISFVQYVKNSVVDYYTWTNNEGTDKIYVEFKDSHDIGIGKIIYTNKGLIYKGSIKMGGYLVGEGKLFDREKNQIINGTFNESKIENGYLENAMFFHKHADFILPKGVGTLFSNINNTLAYMLGYSNWDRNLRYDFKYEYTGKVSNFMFNDNSCIILLEDDLIYQGPIIDGYPVNIEYFLDSFESILLRKGIVSGFEEGQLKRMYIDELKYVN